MSTTLIDQRVRLCLRHVIDEARTDTRTATLDRLAAVLADGEPETDPEAERGWAREVTRATIALRRAGVSAYATATDEHAASLETRIGWLAADRDTARAERDKARADLGEAIAECDTLRGVRDALRVELDQARAHLNAARAQFAKAIAERDTARSNADRDEALERRLRREIGAKVVNAVLDENGVPPGDSIGARVRAVVAELAEVRAERDDARAELAEACLWRDRHRAERDEARADRDAARAERDGLIEVMAGYGIRAEDYPTLGEALDDCMDGTPVSDDIERLTAERDAAIAELAEVRAERDAWKATHGLACDQRDAALDQRDTAIAERDSAIAERDEARTALANVKESHAITRQTVRDTRAERDVIADERDDARLWRDRYRARCNEAREQRDTAIAQLAEVRALITPQAEVTDGD